MHGDWYAGVRVLHILAAALWIGTAVLLTFFVSPAIRGLGPRGAPVMAELTRRRMGTYIAAASGVTMLSSNISIVAGCRGCYWVAGWTSLRTMETPN